MIISVIWKPVSHWQLHSRWCERGALRHASVTHTVFKLLWEFATGSSALQLSIFVVGSITYQHRASGLFFFWKYELDAGKSRTGQRCQASVAVLLYSNASGVAKSEEVFPARRKTKPTHTPLSARMHLYASSVCWMMPSPLLPPRPTVPLKCGPGSKFLGSFMLIPISISGVNKPLQLRLMRLYHGEGSSEVVGRAEGVGMEDGWLSPLLTEGVKGNP